MRNVLMGILMTLGLCCSINAQEIVYNYPYQYGIVNYQYPVTVYQPVLIQPAPVLVYQPVQMIQNVSVPIPVYYKPVVQTYCPCWRRYYNYSSPLYGVTRY